MEKKEAAEFLGVSVRTLERMAAQGRLVKGRARRKTRPVVVFDRTQLESLKAELETNRPNEVFPRKNGPRPLDSIGFRLDPFYVGRLATEGKRQGLSAAEMARKLVVQGLEDTAVQEVKDELSKLRDGLGHMFYAILIKGFGMSEEAADILVQDTILTR